MDTPLLQTCEIVDLLPKEHLTQFLGVAPSRRVTKAQLVEQLVSRIETDESEMARFLERYKHEVAFGPWDVEQILQCTSTERKRWTADGKLPVLAYREFRKAARDIPYPIFDRREILGVASEAVEQWRNEHLSLVQLRRKTGTQKAVASRKAHQQARAAASLTWETMVAVWASQGHRNWPPSCSSRTGPPWCRAGRRPTGRNCGGPSNMVSAMWPESRPGTSKKTGRSNSSCRHPTRACPFTSRRNRTRSPSPSVTNVMRTGARCA